jgi:hypothetical protein
MKPDRPNNRSEWPYTSFLLFGFFGSESPGGKTLIKYTTIALTLFVAGVIGISVFSDGIFLYTSSILIPLSILIVTWSNSEYIKELDTLSQLIQLKAFAFSYGAAMFIGFTIYAVYASTGFFISPIWLVLAEPLRGISLYMIAKEYE